jgi:hypothetical protein
MMLAWDHPIYNGVSNNFEFCQARCRTSSDSLLTDKAYRSAHKHCYGLRLPSMKSLEPETRPTNPPPPKKHQDPVILAEILVKRPVSDPNNSIVEIPVEWRTQANRHPHHSSAPLFSPSLLVSMTAFLAVLLF